MQERRITFFTVAADRHGPTNLAQALRMFVEARNFFGKFLFPTLLQEDPGYLPKRNGSFFGRSRYAATRVFVTRKDHGTPAFNSSEILAIAFSKALTNAYYPDHDRTGR
jgi:hypothetical protein